MKWNTNNLPCNGINCVCSKIIENRERIINNLLKIKTPKRNPFYRGNHSLRNSNIEFELTDKEKLVYEKSIDDIQYFIENIIDKILNIKLYDYQLKMIKSLSKYRFNFLLDSRQSGTSTITAIYIIHYLISNPGASILILSNFSFKIIDIIKRLYSEMPYYLKPGVIRINQLNLKLDNYSSIKLAFKKQAAIGANFDLVIIDDFSTFNNDQKSTVDYLLPALFSRSDSRIIIKTLPDKDLENMYKKLLFNKKVINWKDIPNRNENWKTDIINLIGSGSFMREYDNIFLTNKEVNRYNGLDLID